MTTQNRQKQQHFCIYDYYLDGVYLKWEEVAGECPILVRGQDWVIDLEDGTKIQAKIVETELISENERRVFLNSR